MLAMLPFPSESWLIRQSVFCVNAVQSHWTSYRFHLWWLHIVPRNLRTIAQTHPCTLQPPNLEVRFENVCLILLWQERVLHSFPSFLSPFTLARVDGIFAETETPIGIRIQKISQRHSQGYWEQGWLSYGCFILKREEAEGRQPVWWRSRPGLSSASI
jgi:hypothetical protein